MSFTSMHNDYLDPDIHNPDPDEEAPTVIEYGDSLCRVEIARLRRQAEEAISFIERNPGLFACPWKELFRHAPEGPFEWDQTEAGDWIPSLDDDRWVKNAYAMNMSRDEDGNETVECVSVDSDGNWDTSCVITRKKGRPLSKWDKREYEHESALSHCYYNLLKVSLYSIHVVETGEDPLDDTIGNADPREVHLRNLAHEVPDLCASVYRLAVEELLRRKA
jgi:uncharacterized protein (DUF2249 family)